MTTVRRKPKTLIDKLILWERAFQAVLEVVANEDADYVAHPDVRAAAGRIAAILIQGVDE